MDYQMHRSNCVHEYQCRKLNEFVFGIINTQKAGFFQKHKTKEDKKNQLSPMVDSIRSKRWLAISSRAQFYHRSLP